MTACTRPTFANKLYTYAPKACPSAKPANFSIYPEIPSAIGSTVTVRAAAPNSTRSHRDARDARGRPERRTIKRRIPISSVSTSATAIWSPEARVPVLRVFCADAWPGLIDECEAAMPAVIARNAQRVQKQGCVGVQSYSKRWPCLLPQHGPGHKHHRPIYLAAWQQPVIDRHPGQLLRGLFHSDGCRITNRTRRGDKSYAYPRYNFSNDSRDIMSLCQESLDRLGIAWRMCRPNMLSVARREAVARLDEFVGPKW